MPEEKKRRFSENGEELLKEMILIQSTTNKKKAPKYPSRLQQDKKKSDTLDPSSQPTVDFKPL